MAQAKITIDDTQAKALGLLVYRKKTNPYTAIMFEPKSGVNLRQTRVGESIDVLDSADISNLKNLYAEGYFTVAEGKIADITTLTSITMGTDGMLSINFDQPVHTTGLSTAADELVLTVEGEVQDTFTIGVHPEGMKTIPIDTGLTPAVGIAVSLEIKATGAAKILDAGEDAIEPVTMTCKV